MADKQNMFRVIFHNQGQIYEVYAREIFQSDLYGFIEVEGYVFGSRSQMVVDPSEERLKNEFEDVERSFIPMHAIVRIDEVEKEGQARIKEVKGDKVMPFPTMPTAPRKTD
ncbi:MAG TPA: DUF1820 family protein [Pseudomonadales bacterium]|nr:DUF1820 family protein [Pseudomonadales bacterium]